MRYKIGPYGQGIGGPVQITDNPNSPSSGSAGRMSLDARIVAVIESNRLNDWERNFLMSIYGIDRMTPKQRKVFIRIMAKANSQTS